MDLLILMIGSNNCLSPDKPETIAEGCEWMVQRALYLDIWVNEPRILILAPPVIGGGLDIRAAADYAAGSMRRSRAIVPLYRDIAERCGQYYLDVNEAGVMTCSVDHVHLDETGHLKMSEIITDKVLEIFGILK